MKAKWPCAVPIPRAYDTRAQLAFVKSSGNVERPTFNVQRAVPDSKSSLRLPCGGGFVDPADHRANDDHLNDPADASVKDQFSGNRLDGIKAKAHADRCDFQEKTEPNSCNSAAASETSRVDHHE